MKRRYVPCLVGIFCLSITLGGFSQSRITTKTISNAVAAQTTGTLSDGTGGVFVSIAMQETPTKPAVLCAGNPAPNCLTVQAFDSLSGVFGTTEQVLQPGEFEFNTAKTLNSAMINVTLVSPGTFFDGVTFDLVWTANSPIIKSSTEQTMPGFHLHSSGTTRFATIEEPQSTSSLTGTVLNGPPATCCTWNGDAQISNSLTQTINIIKP